MIIDISDNENKTKIFGWGKNIATAVAIDEMYLKISCLIPNASQKVFPLLYKDT